MGFSILTQKMVCQRLGHLAAGRIAGTEEQDTLFGQFELLLA